MTYGIEEALEVYFHHKRPVIVSDGVVNGFNGSVAGLIWPVAEGVSDKQRFVNGY